MRYAERELKLERLLLSKELSASGGELFLERYGQLINLSKSGQLAMKVVLETHLRRVQWNAHDLASRLYPFVHGEFADAPRIVAIDPFIAFGRPVVLSKVISTQAITDRIDAGESVDTLAEDYGLTEREIAEAIVYRRAA